MEVCAINKLLSLFILISLLLNNKILIESYSQVSRVGSIVSSTNNSNNISTNSEIIIKHNPGREGVFSTSDNDDNNNKTMSESNDAELTTNENKSTEVFTGRSSPAMGGFQFPINFNTQPISYRRPAMAKSNYNPNEKSSTSNSPIFVYPSYGSKNIDETYKYSSNLPPPPATAMDRFSPGEAYGFQQIQKNKNKNGYNYAPPKSQLKEKPASQPPKPSPPPVSQPVLPTAPVSMGPVYIPPKDLYAFPPNIGVNYLPPNMNTNQRPVTSYLPPAAGVSDDFDPNSFVGPVNPKYLPSSNSQGTPQSMMSPDSGSMEMNSPPSDDHNHDHDHDHDHDHNHDHSHDHDHDHPPSGPPSDEGIDYHDHHHDHDHNHNLPSDTPPPPSPNTPTTENPLTQMMAMVVEALKNNNKSPAPPPSPPSPPSPSTGNDITFSSPDHSHFHYPDHDFHHDDHDFHGQYGVDAFPELVYDHDPHDHHHDVVVTTTEPPPPPPEEHMESRVKKYSYYYLGRKLWYIPLYFTVYFSFYVAALIIRSIGRHKVEWPNHYQKRSIDDNMSHKETVRKVEKLTNFVMNSIEDFKEKYL